MGCCGRLAETSRARYHKTLASVAVLANNPGGNIFRVSARQSKSIQREMENRMRLEQGIREKLMIGLEPVRLDVINESEKHAGHRSSPGTGESHFRVLVVSEKFSGVSRVARHRMVNQLIADELAGGVHALALATYAPGEKF